MPFPSPVIGETSVISCAFRGRSGEAFTIDDATLTIQAGDETPIRDEVNASIDGSTVYYIESFTSGSGYVTGTEYTVTFTALIDVNGTSYTEIYSNTITVLESPDTTINITDLTSLMRKYIGDEGESVSRNVMGLADGSRRQFLLHHNNVDQNTLNVLINGTGTDDFVVVKNMITFDTAPSLNASIVADYKYFQYSDDMLELCIQGAVASLNSDISLGWGQYNGTSWNVNATDEAKNIVLTYAIMIFLNMQMVQLPVAISFGDIGARISLRGASGERQRAIQELRTLLYSQIDEYLISRTTFDIIT